MIFYFVPCNTAKAYGIIIKKAKEKKVMGEIDIPVFETKNMRSFSANGKIVYANGSEEMIPHGLSEVAARAYKKRADIVSVVLPSGVKRIGASAFSWCTSLESIVIPDSVTSIGGDAFEYCENLASIVIPPDVRTVCKGAFEYCTGLRSVTLPEGLEKIGEAAFHGCESLEAVKLPESIFTIGDNAFLRCKKITEIEIPSRIAEIGNCAFSECDSLMNVKISFGAQYIVSGKIWLGSGAFSHDRKLVSVSIPKGVKEISGNTFEYCESLENIYYEGSRSDWRKIKIGKFGNDKLNGNIFKRAKVHYECK